MCLRRAGLPCRKILRDSAVNELPSSLAFSLSLFDFIFTGLSARLRLSSLLETSHPWCPQGTLEGARIKNLNGLKCTPFINLIVKLTVDNNVIEKYY